MSIVSFRNAGRYGNQLFEIAATYAYAKMHGIDFSVPNKTHDQFWQPVYYTHLANKNWIPGREDILINENGHEYQELFFDESWKYDSKQIVLNGYFQSEKYFKEYRQEIIDLFGYTNSFPKIGYTSVFVRRGDYLKYADKHPPATVEYLMAAMDFVNGMSGCTNFIYFSDDIDWCKNNIKSQKYNIEFCTGLPFDIELKYMSACEHQIGSNSTFSWWAAWFNQNPNKICVAPKEWFGPGNSHLNTKDICPENWIRL